MLDEKIIKEIEKQDSFEWSQSRYYYDKSISTLFGHAKKHLKKECNNFKRIFNYNVNNIDSQAVDNYKKISIENIYKNKYNKNRIYFNKKNGSINIIGENNLETCLKPCISKNNKYVITTCFFRDYIYYFYNELNNYTKEDLKPVYKFLNINNILNNDETKTYNVEEILEKFILSLKENRSKDIVGMIDEYYGKESNFNKGNIATEINNLFIETKNKIDNLKELAKENELILNDIKTQEYIPTEPSIGDFNEFLEEYDNNILKNEFLNLLELSDIYDIINDLCIVYIYYKLLSNDLNILIDWCKYMHYIIQLNTENNDLRNTILKTKNLIVFDGYVNNNLYDESGIYLNFFIKKEKHDKKTIMNKIQQLSKNTDDSTLISCYYCKNCGEYIYLTQKIDFTSNQKQEHPKCNKCDNEELEYIISNADVI